ncbi:uncharacterized protein EI90DRAFT_2996369, partial [Cantharellus anzutake]|uniref:uncharacterized protein n=1 Tax=Cantharellus anzutake TaxID=1750568 RepID=UPI001907CF58
MTEAGFIWGECQRTRIKVRRKIPWPVNLDISYIMAAPIIEIKAASGRSKVGEIRLFRIVVLECAWQLWKARCRRVMNPDRPQTTYKEVKNALKAGLNDKLHQDIALTNRNKYGRKALPPKLVLHTWSGNLQNEESQPDNWLSSSGVLVGI